MKRIPNKKGYFGKFGGRFVPETLFSALKELEQSYTKIKRDKTFWEEVSYYLNTFAGRPTPLYLAKNISKRFKQRIYLKREDLCHTGAHKINNTLGQIILAKRMNKKRVIAETGAGQHGVAVATVGSLFNFPCDIYMGKKDIERQRLNVLRMRLLGANVIPVTSGTQTLKDAVNETIRDWVTNVSTTYYLLGSSVGPHPYPMIVRDFQSVIGKETKKQILQKEHRFPDYLIACVGGGSNAIGLFYPFFDNEVKFIGVEAGGLNRYNNAASLTYGKIGILHGTKSYILMDKNGQILNTYSIAPGLDYPGVGPEHSFYKDIKRAKYVTVTDKEAMDAFKMLSQEEGIIPALEPSHALAYTFKLAKEIKNNSLIVVCLSGRGDKDMHIYEEYQRTKPNIKNQKPKTKN